MKKHSIIASIAGCLALASVGIQAAVAQTSEEAFYPQWVEYRDDHISFAFDQIPVVDRASGYPTEDRLSVYSAIIS